MHIVILGPAYPLRGGLANFDQRLAREFMAEGHKVTMYTYSLQYPGFLFPGTSQYSDEPAPEDLDIKVVINSANPLNWRKVGRELRKLRPDLIVVRYWIPYMGACQGSILRQVKKNGHTKVVCITDNVIPHEKRPGDTWLTQYFIKPVDGFITMSASVQKDLQHFTDTPSRLVVHPLFDNFGDPVPQRAAREKLDLPDGPLILFFGFIRKYKGLDLLFKAMRLLKDRNSRVLPKLMVAGEYYGGKEEYEKLISELDIENQLIMRTSFIADSEVRYYLSAADFVIQPYRDATQSGVTPLAYHFEKPMLVTNVGGLPDLVPDDQVGVVTEPTPGSIADGIEQLYTRGAAHYLPFLKSEKERYSWAKFSEAILDLGK
ncbi:Glycosyltransferase involved in cell wall bisynthesis [Arachidicoccus rhizosphaerae]|uniref:Glycosyltransferase involved in cell wall bisynthesis n=1 Tax=Arachidicoccus rhizosphaerae TaxID=551991 RepID=A0A1H4C1R5_9BACT|nr:glycosyltransferase family 4 protein [Arachidicoccus rhizosphaerae]SEA54270.1 Glycosyltransferase involved in cell wall bisynthesis [Arachidicoccus rhizosphaerae]